MLLLLIFKRSLHYKRVPNYEGWWTQILKDKTPSVAVEPVIQRMPISIPFEEVEPIVEKPSISTPTVVYLNNEPISLPIKPDSPENCCMR